MPDWDDIFREKGFVFTEPHHWMQNLVQHFREHKVNRTLDLGCGTGRHLVYLAKQGFEMYGFDSSPRAISLAKEWLEEESLIADIQIFRMEEPFPYNSDFFDAVISTQVIHHNLMNNILTTVNEIERVLRPGGVLFLSFPVLSEGPIHPDDDWDMKEIEPGTYLPRKGPEAGIPHHYFTLEELPEVFKAFKILEVFLDDYEHRCMLGIKR